MVIALRSPAVLAVLPVAKLPITILPIGLSVSVSLLFLPTARVHTAVPIPIVFLTLLAFFTFETMIARFRGCLWGSETDDSSAECERHCRFGYPVLWIPFHN